LLKQLAAQMFYQEQKAILLQLEMQVEMA